jgi:predicted amidohydrolase
MRHLKLSVVALGAATLVACTSGQSTLKDDAAVTPLVDTHHPSKDAPGIEASSPEEDFGNVPHKDYATPPPPVDTGVPIPDSGPIVPPPAGAIKVAAIQYGPLSYQSVSGCTDVNCGLIHFVKEAAAQGAQYIVTPEGVPDQGQYAMYDPAIGDKPAVNPKWSGTVVGTWAQMADQLNVTLIFNTVTQVGSGTTAQIYNTNIAVDGTGTVVGVHHKFFPWGETGVTAGTNCCDTFQTPAGKAGLLICADIQCVFKIDLNQSTGSCKADPQKLLTAYGADNSINITFFSSYWMATGSTSSWWKPVNAWSIFAKWSGTYMVAANTISGSTLQYRGGGIFDPTGKQLAFYDQKTPGIAIATIPKPGTTPPPPTGSKVVITEFMADPSAVTDANGEWVELYNADTATVDLSGWQIKDASSTTTIGSSVTIAPGKYIVLGKNTTTSTNGGVTMAGALSNWSLSNTSDSILLYDSANTLIDQVAYDSSWSIPSGASKSLKDVALDNNVAANWCTETTAWSGSAGDKGTPGAAAVCK